MAKDEEKNDETILSDSQDSSTASDPEPEVTEPETAPAPEPKPKPKPVDPELKPRPANTYVLKQGDNPSKVAMDLYGSVGRARELVIKNFGSKWQTGDIIQLL